MRSSLLNRLLIAVGLIATIGIPGLQQLDPTIVSAQPAAYGMPASDVWTGVMASPAGAAVVAEQGSEPTEGLIVRFRPGTARSQQVGAHQAAGARRADALALSDAVRVDVPAGRRAGALATYNARPDVRYAEPDYEVHALFTPNDPQFPSQWALAKIGAPAAWDVTRGSSAVRVAVVDCGVFSEGTGRLASDGQAGHPDLRGRVALNRDFTSSPTGFDDYCNHGTHVAGIVAATQDNAVGVSGLAPEVALINAKVLNDGGSGSTSDILDGVVWAVQNGAKVVNMSLGRDGPCSQSERDTMDWAWSQGVVIVAAAGNSKLGSSGAPANCDNVISVASTNSSDRRSSFSNYGTDVDVAAPGSGILSTVRSGGYESFDGTSMASPHVAALAGLIWSQGTGATAQSVVDRIRTTADRIPGTGSLWAWGRINAAAALSGGAQHATSTATSTATPIFTSVPTATSTATPTSTSVPTATSTATLVPRATSTSVPTSTATLVPMATQGACPSPRPRVQIAMSATSPTSFAVTLQAGVGVIRQIVFRDLRNVAITVGTQSGSASPSTYQPTTDTTVVSFAATRADAGQPWNVGLAVTDDCGTWNTFVGGGATSGLR